MKYSLGYRYNSGYGGSFLTYIWTKDDFKAVLYKTEIKNVIYFDSIKSVYEQIVNDVFNYYRTYNIWGHRTYIVYNGDKIEKIIYINKIMEYVGDVMLSLISYQSSSIINEWLVNKIIKKIWFIKICIELGSCMKEIHFCMVEM